MRLGLIAADYGQTRAGWVAALLAHVVTDMPMTRRDELTALAASNRQLWAIGTTLNQIARAMNVEIKVRGHTDGEQLPVELMRECRIVIEGHTAATAALIAANRCAYRRVDAAGPIADSQEVDHA